MQSYIDMMVEHEVGCAINDGILPDVYNYEYDFNELRGDIENQLNEIKSEFENQPTEIKTELENILQTYNQRLDIIEDRVVKITVFLDEICDTFKLFYN